jgi:hypothetical protein
MDVTVNDSNFVPHTAKTRGRPKGATTEIGQKMLNEWPAGVWVTVSFSDGDDVIKTARSLRNLAHRNGITASVLTDRNDPNVIYVLKLEKE